ncbi:dihydrolipoyl dehydrogenase [Bacillus thuringiensis]
MERHEVSNNKGYRGYYSLSNDIMEDLYGEEEEILEWDEMVNQYQPILTSKGLQLKRKRDSI